MAHAMALEGGIGDSPHGRALASRFAGIGAQLPGRRPTTGELMTSTGYRTGIELEQLTGALECTETALLLSAGAGITVGAAVSRW